MPQDTPQRSGEGNVAQNPTTSQIASQGEIRPASGSLSEAVDEEWKTRPTYRIDKKLLVLQAFDLPGLSEMARPRNRLKTICLYIYCDFNRLAG